MSILAFMGRNKEFNIDEALDNVMEAFWKKGFKETSLNDLMEATGLQKGSLYGAFESKENLLLLALEKYGERSKLNFIREENPLDYICKFFEMLVHEGVHKKNYKGCLIMNTCIELASEKNKPAQLSRKLFSEIEKNFKNALNIAVKQNLLDSDNIESLSSRLIASAFAIREISKFRRDESFLKAIANGVLSEIGREI